VSEQKPKPEKGDVTIQPSISTDEAAQTDSELSPVGDEKFVVGEEPLKPPVGDETDG
jgi:hypothetical protein